MKIINKLLNSLFNSEKTKKQRELEQFLAERKHERNVFEAALKQWVLQSGLGPVILDQTEQYAIDCGLQDGWGEQLEMYDRDRFDLRNPKHKAIYEYVIKHAHNDGDPVVSFDTGRDMIGPRVESVELTLEDKERVREDRERIREGALDECSIAGDIEEVLDE